MAQSARPEACEDRRGDALCVEEGPARERGERSPGDVRPDVAFLGYGGDGPREARPFVLEAHEGHQHGPLARRRPGVHERVFCFNVN